MMSVGQGSITGGPLNPPEKGQLLQDLREVREGGYHKKEGQEPRQAEQSMGFSGRIIPRMF